MIYFIVGNPHLFVNANIGDFTHCMTGSLSSPFVHHDRSTC